tara:strand:+ start:6249 stop:6677 length:429 start_codon:yes stop_codon:yes gene_type:complete
MMEAGRPAVSSSNLNQPISQLEQQDMNMHTLPFQNLLALAGIPTGQVFSFTFPPAEFGDSALPSMLVLVKLEGGPLVMGTLDGVRRQDVEIGSGVRMLCPDDEDIFNEEIRFELVGKAVAENSPENGVPVRRETGSAVLSAD